MGYMSQEVTLIRGDGAFRDQTIAAFVFAGKDEDRVARCDLIAAIHRLQVGEIVYSCVRILDLGLDREQVQNPIIGSLPGRHTDIRERHSDDLVDARRDRRDEQHHDRDEDDDTRLQLQNVQCSGRLDGQGHGEPADRRRQQHGEDNAEFVRPRAAEQAEHENRQRQGQRDDG